MTCYEYGYVEGLAPRHQLILIDARGHGESDKPHQGSAYAGDVLAFDVVAVLDDLAIERAAYFGHSMGGTIGLSQAHCAPTRFTALGIGAAPPDRGQSDVVDGFVPLLQKGPAAMITAWRALGELSPQLTDRILAIDCVALLALHQADRTHHDELDTDALARFPGRYRFLMGSGDWFYADMCAASDRLEPGSLVTIAGVNHLEFFQRSDLLIPHLSAFLDDDNVADH